MYHSSEAAIEDVDAIRLLPSAKRVPVRVYRCLVCKMWHSTSEPYRPSKHFCLDTSSAAPRFKFKNRQESKRAAWEVGREDDSVRCKKCKQLHFDPELAPPS